MSYINQLWNYYDRWSTWNTLSSSRQALRVKTKALILTDRLI